MGYLSKSLIFKCYKSLSNLTSDHRQGQTQAVSLLRHVCALDIYYKRNNTECDVTKRNTKSEFIGYVKTIVQLDDGSYCANFYSKIAGDDDCGVGSNFFSQGAVSNSRSNPTAIFQYPTRGNNFLMDIKNGCLIRNSNYYGNINNILFNDELKTAFALWLLRAQNIDFLNIEGVIQGLSKSFTDELTKVLLPNSTFLSNYLQGESLVLDKATLYAQEILDYMGLSEDEQIDEVRIESEQPKPEDIKRVFTLYLEQTNQHMNDKEAYVDNIVTKLDPELKKHGLGDTLFQYYHKNDVDAVLNQLIQIDSKYQGYTTYEWNNYFDYRTWTTVKQYRQFTEVLDAAAPFLSAKSDPAQIQSSYVDKSYNKYITAIKTKPFVLLAGISGTGKSRIVRELARACWAKDSEEYNAHKPSNYEMIQVKPNWHDSSELLGYVSRIDGEKFIAGDFLKFIVKAWENPVVPYFLCLDEMNLAPVEQYFAEYLSVIESRKAQEDGSIITDPILRYDSTQWYYDLVHALTENQELRDCFMKKKEDGGIGGISIPQNLIVIGTVNMDETTYSFSRKVLDRAMTIEMNEVNLNGGLTNEHEEIGLVKKTDVIGTAVEGKDIYSDNQTECDMVIEWLQKVNDALEGSPFKIAYRTRNEFLLYVVNALRFCDDIDDNDAKVATMLQAFDEVTCMKILPRIEGDANRVGKYLDELDNALKDNGLADDCSSRKKIDCMKKRLKNGYCSFWD